MKRLWKWLRFKYLWWRSPLFLGIDPAGKNGDYGAIVHFKLVDGISYITDIKLTKQESEVGE